MKTIEFSNLRERAGLSIEDLSRQPGFSPRTLYRWENGETVPRQAAVTLLNALEKYTLSDKLWNYLQGYAEKHRLKGNGFGFGLIDENCISRTLSARYYKDGSEILIKQKGKNPRRLTPRECARLMGFDKPGMSDFIIPVSDTQAYKQFSNAVVVPVVEAIARYMKPWLANDNGESVAMAKQKDLFAVA